MIFWMIFLHRKRRGREGEREKERDRERERERQTDRQTDRQTEKQGKSTIPVNLLIYDIYI